MRNHFIALVATGIVAVTAAETPASAASLQEVMQDYLNDIFPYESKFRPTLGDPRFAPKTIWVHKDNLRATGKKNKTTSGYVIASSGRQLYPDDIAPVYSMPVPQFQRSMTDLRKWALGLSLAGNIGDVVDLEAAVRAAREKGYELEFSYESAALDYVFYDDMVAAQQRAIKIGLLNDMRQRWKTDSGDLANYFTVSASLRVSGAKLRLVNTRAGQQGVSIAAPIVNLFNALGFNFDRERNTVTNDTVDFGGDYYLGYQSLEAGKRSGLISSGAGELSDTIVIADEEQYAPWLGQ